MAVAALKNLKDKVQNEIQKYRGTPATRQQRTPHTNDFARLARRLCGKSIGLVLGGGGARGLSHLVRSRNLRALYVLTLDCVGIGVHSSVGGIRDSNRPYWGYVSVEAEVFNFTQLRIIGTSIGAFVGGLYAREGDLITSSARAKQFGGRMGNIWRLLSDVTYPIVAYTTVNLLEVVARTALISLTRVMSSTGQYGRRFTTSTLKTCGCHSSAIPPTSSPPGCRYTKRDMPGDTSVSANQCWNLRGIC